MKLALVTQVSVLLLAVNLASPGHTQTTPRAGSTGEVAQPPQTIPASDASTRQGAQKDATDNSTYATGKPLAGQSKEGFWGKVNPFARKKWVNRQIDPIKDRTNELDQLQSKNASDIRDVDSRSQAGINRALTSANAADQHAALARNAADAASGVAADASKKTSALGDTVSNLDQYQAVSTIPVLFAPGHTTLSYKAKAGLDDLASRLMNEKGYIIEVQAYSSGGVRASQAMAESVARYLVTQHQVPIYRIYKTGLGKNSKRSSEGEKTPANGVLVSLMHNSLATMSSSALNGAAEKTVASSGATPHVD